MKIHKQKVTRKITEEEFLRLKKQEPFATFRQDAKACNFGLIFNMSFKKFSQTVLEVSWSLERIHQFVKDKKLEKEVSAMKERYPDIESKLWSYYACAQYIHDNFFETYPGLLSRVKRNEELGKTTGYIRAYCGAIRRFPLLSLATTPDGKWRKNENLKEMAGEVNTCANTDIQSLEIFTVAPAMIEWTQQDCYSNAPIIGTVHDSVDLIVDKDKAVSILKILKDIFEREYDWQKGIKMPVDFTIVDFTNPKHYMKHGYEYEEFLKLSNEGKV